MNLAYYVPSHDIIMSILMQIRFDKSGSVRTRSFEVLPTQIFVAGSSNDAQVKSLENTITFLAALRFICSTYTFLLGCMKVYYRQVIGPNAVFWSVVNDIMQISFAIAPVIQSFGIQDRLNLDDLSKSDTDFHALGRQQ